MIKIGWNISLAITDKFFCFNYIQHPIIKLTTTILIRYFNINRSQFKCRFKNFAPRNLK